MPHDPHGHGHGHDDDHDHGDDVPIETDLHVAREALADRDLTHAAHHVAAVAAKDPEHPELPALLDALMQATEDPLSLVPLEEGVFYGTVALHAAMLARLGDTSEAVGLLLQAQAVKPGIRYVPWAERWLGTQQARAALELPTVFAGVTQCLRHDGLTRQLLPLLRKLVAERPPEATLAFVAARALRTTGNVDEAIAVAHRAHAEARGYMTGIALAMALKAKGDLDGAVAAYRDALALQPEDVAARRDIGDLELGRGRWDSALAAYEEVLAIDPRDDWALPSAAYVRVVRGGEGSEAALAKLRELAAAGSRRARDLLGEHEPYVASFRTPSSSLADMAAHVAARRGEAAPTRVTISSIEPPSAILGLAETVRAFGKEASYPVEFAEIPEPDPRRPRVPVAHVVWEYDGTTARPGLRDADTSRVAPAVARLAASEYDLASWATRGAALGGELGPAAVRPLLATMAQPPERPQGVSPWEWRFRAQVAAAMTLAGVDAGWRDSARRAALLSLLQGPLDWTTTAGILALVELVRREPRLRDEVVNAILDEMLAPASPIRYQCVVEPAIPLLLARVPLPADVAAALRDMRARNAAP